MDLFMRLQTLRSYKETGIYMVYPMNTKNTFFQHLVNIVWIVMILRALRGTSILSRHSVGDH